MTYLIKAAKQKLYKEVYPINFSKNKLFVEYYSIPTQSLTYSELLEYHISLYGYFNEYEIFKNEMRNENLISSEKYKYLSNSVLSIILTTRFQIFNYIYFKPDFFYVLKQKDILNDFWNTVDRVSETSTWISDTKEFINTKLDSSQLLTDQLRDINVFINYETDLISIFNNPDIIRFVETVDSIIKNEKIVLNFTDIKRIKILYNNRFVNKRLISIDLKKAWYQILILWDIIPNIPFDLFVKQFTNNKYLFNNKPLRQVIHGNLNTSRIDSLVKRITTEIYHEAKKLNNVIEIYINGLDELIIVTDSEKETSDLVIINNAILNKRSIFGNIEVSIEIFNLKALNTNAGEFFYKEYDNGTKILKGVPMPIYPQIYKLLHNIEFNKKDLWYENKVTNSITEFLEPIKLI